jgi:hypothetical protein
LTTSRTKSRRASHFTLVDRDLFVRQGGSLPVKLAASAFVATFSTNGMVSYASSNVETKLDTAVKTARATNPVNASRR